MKRFLILTILFLCIFSCYSVDSTLLKGLKTSIDKAKNSNDFYIKVNEITEFDWDKMFIFTPYTPIKTIYNRLGFKWYKAIKTDIHARDDINLIVFIINKKVVNFFEFPRSYGDFSEIKLERGLTKEEAVFLLDIRDDWPYLKLSK